MENHIRIYYKPSVLYNNRMIALLFMGLGLVLFIISLIFDDAKDISWFSIGLGEFIVGILMFAYHKYEVYKQYLTLTETSIKKNTLFGKEVQFKDVNQVKEFANEITVISKSSQIVIDTEVIQPESLKRLKKALHNKRLSINKIEVN